MIPVPSDKKKLLRLALDLVEACRVSVSERSHYYRLMSVIAQTGRYDGRKSLINTMNKHLDRTASHLYSPVELKFSMDFENEYPRDFYKQAKVAAKVLTRQWERQGTSQTFARGVSDALLYGCSIMKQWSLMDRDKLISHHDKLVTPWQFGVYNENETRIDNQIALCETMSLTMPEVWRRVWHLPDGEKVYARILAHANTDSPIFEPQTMFHQVLSTSQLNTGVQQSTRPLPGGIVQLGNDPSFSIMGPRVGVPTVNMHEIWVKDTEDYTTIQVIEPDVIVAPVFKKENLLSAGSQLQPYRVIRPNEITNYFWGISDLADLIEPQGFLADQCDDYRRLSGLQIDKIFAFIGMTGMTAERYGAMRAAGYMSADQGTDIKDMTPQVPNNGMDAIKFLIETISMLGGYPPIMQGQGEPGVRAGVHADRLTKNASPTLRDRSLIVERQLADCADLTMAIREAKDERFYWTDGDSAEGAEQTSFLLGQLPADWRITVDSHSSSPIFSDENTQLVFAAQGKGIVDEEYVIDNVPLPNKEGAKVSLRQRKQEQAKQQQALLQANPVIAEEVREKSIKRLITGGKK